MFSPRAILILLFIAGLSLLAMIIATLSRPAIVSVTPGTLAWPEAAAEINDIRQIQVVSGTESVTITRQGDANDWVVLEAGGYGADPGLVRRVLVGVAELRLTEARTAEPSLHGRLSLLDPRIGTDADAASGGQGLALTLGTDTQDLGTFILGQPIDRQPGQPVDALYVRFSGEDQSWLAEENLAVPGTVLGWLPQRIMSVRDSRVWSVEVTGPDRPLLEVRREDWQSDHFELTALPADRVLGQPFRVNNVATVLEDLDLTDVRPSDGLTIPAVADQAKITTYDGMIVTATLVPDPDNNNTRWVIFNAEIGPLLEPTPLTNTGAPFFQTPEEVATEIDTLNAAVEGWAFRLPRFKMDRLRVVVDDITDPAG